MDHETKTDQKGFTRIPSVICPICGRKYEGWAVIYKERKCCGKVLKVQQEGVAYETT